MIVTPSCRVFASFSKKPGTFGATVYAKLFEEHGIEALYLPRAAPDTAEQLVDVVRSFGLAGASVSSPHKSAVVPLLDEVDDQARLANAVNTIVNNAGRLTGYCTDIAGVTGAVAGLPKGGAVVFGAGGVTGPVIAGLRAAGYERISIAARRPEAAAEAAEAFGISAEPIDRPALVVNATPMGGEINDSPQLWSLLERSEAVLDLPVSAADTALIAAARQRSLAVATGVDMCVHQIREQAERYLGRAFGVDQIRRIVVDDYLSAKP